MALSRLIKKRGRKNKPPAGSIPTYIRFTGGMLKEIDRATEEGGYINASEFVREAVRLFIREMRRVTFSPGEHQELVHGGKPTYIRFMEIQLDVMDSAVGEGKFLSRSEFARTAVERLLSTEDPATKAR
jgi:Arc/MetJ-type ribon-helix-helix transcriptional regulator